MYICRVCVGSIKYGMYILVGWLVDSLNGGKEGEDRED